jgi:alkanesulfonate monooxygenase SsuD/methylene tetrahydromethanopterin reductase-like flavin-dependent oxidoreductase (luciferase family)
VVIAPTEAALQAPLADARRRLAFFGDVDAIATIGTPDRCIDTIRRKIAQGITYFVCLFTDGGQPDTVRAYSASASCPRFAEHWGATSSVVDPCPHRRDR